MKLIKYIRPNIHARLPSLLMAAAMLALNTVPALAQSTTFSSTDLRTGISNSLAVIMMFGFVLGKIVAPFEHEERYHELSKRQSEIEEKLDLTKNQAPSQVQAESVDENEEKNSRQQTQTKSNRQTQRIAVRV